MINSERKLAEQIPGSPSQNAPDKPAKKQEMIPVKVNDLRSPSARSFNLDDFLKVIERMRTEDFFKLTREFGDDDYGKYMMFASSESNSWREAIRGAQAIEITLTTIAKNLGIESLMKGTDVEVKVLMSGTQGRVFNFRFDGEGKYHSAGWDNVYLRKSLGESEKPDDFKLVKDEKNNKQIE